MLVDANFWVDREFFSVRLIPSEIFLQTMSRGESEDGVPQKLYRKGTYRCPGCGKEDYAKLVTGHGLVRYLFECRPSAGGCGVRWSQLLEANDNGSSGVIVQKGEKKRKRCGLCREFKKGHKCPFATSTNVQVNVQELCLALEQRDSNLGVAPPFLQPDPLSLGFGRSSPPLLPPAPLPQPLLVRSFLSAVLVHIGVLAPLASPPDVDDKEMTLFSLVVRYMHHGRPNPFSMADWVNARSLYCAFPLDEPLTALSRLFRAPVMLWNEAGGEVRVYHVGGESSASNCSDSESSLRILRPEAARRDADAIHIERGDGGGLLALPNTTSGRILKRAAELFGPPDFSAMCASFGWTKIEGQAPARMRRSGLREGPVTAEAFADLLGACTRADCDVLYIVKHDGLWAEYFASSGGDGVELLSPGDFACDTYIKNTTIGCRDRVCAKAKSCPCGKIYMEKMADMEECIGCKRSCHLACGMVSNQDFFCNDCL